MPQKHLERLKSTRENTAINKSRSHGIAMITALWMMVFLLILGLAFETVITMDLHFAARQESKAAAFFLARASMEYYLHEGIPKTPLHIPMNDPHHICLIQQDPVSRDLTFHSTMTDASERVVAECILIAPGGDTIHWIQR